MVYQDFDTNLKRIVAIKIFQPANDAKRAQKLAGFMYEARLASALDHPNICRSYALIEDERDACTVMEFIGGQNLFELAYGRPLEIKSAVEMVLQAADALAAAHARGIIHRDIKPRNVMVDAAGRAVVLDFGPAKHLENQAAGSAFEKDEPEGDFFYGDIAESLFITMDGVPYGTPSTSPPKHAAPLPKVFNGRSIKLILAAALILTVILACYVF